MKKSIFLFFILCMVFSVSSCKDESPYEPKGAIETTKLETLDFRKINVSDEIKVYVSKSPETSVLLTTFDDVYDKLNIYSDGTTLFAANSSSYDLSGIQITLNVELNDFSELNIFDNAQINLKTDFSSSDDLYINTFDNSNFLGKITGKDLFISSSDNSYVTVFGDFEEVNIISSDNSVVDLSSALIDKTNLSAKDNCKINIKTIGDIKVTAKNMSTINVFGGNVVEVDIDTSATINYVTKK